MAEESGNDHISKRVVVYRLPGAESVEVRQDVEYRTDAPEKLTMDIYYPPERGAAVPVVIIVAGYPDPGFERALGCKFKEMGATRSWGRLIAASGIAAITYTNRTPESDLDALIRHLKADAAALGIDAGRIGLWASSGNVPLALSLLMNDKQEHPKCAVLCYGVMLDAEGSSEAAQLAAKFGFAYPCADKSASDVKNEIPLFIARAGRDEFPHLNETLDRFIAGAIACNLPLTLVNHPTGPHAFDLMDDSETSRAVIGEILAFMRFHLLV